jgi:hypothetical protein
VTLLQKGYMVSVVKILFVSAMLADTNHRIPKIATFKNKKTVTPGSRRVGPRSGPVAIDVVSSWWRPWSKPPAASRIFKAARCRCVRPDRRRAVAAHCRHMPHETRSPPWSKPPTTSQISEAAHCHMPHETRPPPRRGRSCQPLVGSPRLPTATA